MNGTDFQIPATRPGKSFYSHKFKKSGLRYEVALSIIGGNIVWIHGPFEAGLWPDVKIYRTGLIHQLGENERVEADDGYIGEDPRTVKAPGGFTRTDAHGVVAQEVRARQETVNKQFKSWGCLKQVFRHDVEKHSACFRAVVVLTQISLKLGEPLFEVFYDDEEDYL